MTDPLKPNIPENNFYMHVGKARTLEAKTTPRLSRPSPGLSRQRTGFFVLEVEAKACPRGLHHCTLPICGYATSCDVNQVSIFFFISLSLTQYVV